MYLNERPVVKVIPSVLGLTLTLDVFKLQYVLKLYVTYWD